MPSPKVGRASGLSWRASLYGLRLGGFGLLRRLGLPGGAAWRLGVPVKDGFNEIIQATSLEASKAAYRRFLGNWSKELPKIARSLEEAGEELLTFYAFPQEQWKCLRTTNPIERLNGEFKRRMKTQCSLPSEDSAMLILFGLILSEQIRFRKIDGWSKMVEIYRQEIQEKRHAS